MSDRQPEPAPDDDLDVNLVREDDKDPVPDDLGDEDQVPVPDSDLDFPATGDDSQADDEVEDPDILDDDSKAVG